MASQPRLQVRFPLHCMPLSFSPVIITQSYRIFFSLLIFSPLQVLAASKNKISTLKGFPHLPLLEVSILIITNILKIEFVKDEVIAQ